MVRIEELLAGPLLERPRDPKHGDYTTTIVPKLAAILGLDPRQLAERIVRRINENG